LKKRGKSEDTSRSGRGEPLHPLSRRFCKHLFEKERKKSEDTSRSGRGEPLHSLSAKVLH